MTNVNSMEIKIPTYFKTTPLSLKISETRRFCSFTEIFLIDDSWKLTVKEAVSDWNNSFKTTLAIQKTTKNIFPVEYEQFFYEDDSLEQLMSKLKLDITEEMAGTYKNMLVLAERYDNKRENILSSQDKRYIMQNANFGDYLKLNKSK